MKNTCHINSLKRAKLGTLILNKKRINIGEIKDTPMENSINHQMYFDIYIVIYSYNKIYMKPENNRIK